MNVNPPSERQTRVLWFSLTALAVAVALTLLGVSLWGLGYVLRLLTPVLLPLAIAGMLAYLLDPVVTFFVNRKQPRARAILIVFLLLTLFVTGMLATVVPRLVVETNEFVSSVPEYSRTITKRVTDWISESRWASELIKGNTEKPTDSAAVPPEALGWVGKVIPPITTWFVEQAQRVASWIGLLLGLLLVPVYLFYFLLERDRIVCGWRDYLPIKDSKLKEEVVFVISSINDSLIVFIRGQVLVGLCSGAILTVAFFAMGLNYALFLGVLAGLLGIIPYLGAAISLIPAVTLAAVQFHDWLHPVLVLLSFAGVNVLEGLVISPKIIGTRVGLHPLTIIVAVMTGTTLLGGLVGGLLAIPLTAALRTIMFRYVWRQNQAPSDASTTPSA